MGYFSGGPDIITMLVLILIIVFYDLIFGDGDFWK